MKMRVWTTHPNYYIRETCKLLKSKGYGSECDALLNGQFDGEQVNWDQLSLRQFNALEDTAVRMGLQYDGR